MLVIDFVLTFHFDKYKKILYNTFSKLNNDFKVLKGKVAIRLFYKSFVYKRNTSKLSILSFNLKY